jgi:hypothetical protein
MPTVISEGTRDCMVIAFRQRVYPSTSRKEAEDAIAFILEQSGVRVRPHEVDRALNKIAEVAFDLARPRRDTRQYDDSRASGLLHKALAVLEPLV